MFRIPRIALVASAAAVTAISTSTIDNVVQCEQMKNSAFVFLIALLVR